MVLKSVLKKKTHETMKQELLNSLKENDDEEEPSLKETTTATSDPQEAILIIHRYEDIIKTQNKKAISYTGKQGQLLEKFKAAGQFFENVGLCKSTIYCKISLYEFLKKCSALKKSTLSSNYFKNNFNTIKAACKTNISTFYKLED